MKEQVTAFKIKLELEGVIFEALEVKDGIDVVAIKIIGINCPLIQVACVFDTNDRNAQLRCYSICKVSYDKRWPILEFINNFNAKNRWLKLLIDGKNEINCETDIMFNIDTAAEQCFKTLIDLVNAVDDKYSELNKILLS